MFYLNKKKDKYNEYIITSDFSFLAKFSYNIVIIKKIIFVESMKDYNEEYKDRTILFELTGTLNYSKFMPKDDLTYSDN
jgi:hypothetical protein